MRILRHSIAAGLGSICVLGSAAAADLTGAEIQALISSKTGYVETGAGSVRPRRDLLGGGWQRSLQNSAGAYLAWHLVHKRQPLLQQVERRAE